jgi:GR25 family glycosyltransferase involved in LPS biosynthesis
MGVCVFINLPAASARRASVEASFGAAGAIGWTLRRFEALGPADVTEVTGVLTPREKACFASHRAALASSLDDDGPILIVEDDSLFAPGAFTVLDALLALTPAWDLVYTDVALTDLALMIELARRRDVMAGRGEVMALDLAGRPYAGAGAYAVSGPAKRRLHDALSRTEMLDRPIDLLLRDLAASGEFRAATAFPFLTAPAPLADQGSQIQTGEAAAFDAAFNIFRRAMWRGRDAQQSAQDLAWLQAQAGGHTERLVGGLFAAFAAPGFPLYR